MTKAIIIHKASECTVKVFMQCAFDSDFKALLLNGEADDNELYEAWNSIYTEYVDLSGMIESEEFDLMKTILYLDLRVKKIKLLIHIQRESIEKIGVPCVGGFDRLKTYGHKFIWDPACPDIESFLRMLTNIESQEKRYEIELGGKISELIQLKKRQKDKQLPKIQKRKEFIRTLNNLEKAGYRIDRDKTTVEDLALIINAEKEAVEKAHFSNNNR